MLFVWPDGRAIQPDTIAALFHRPRPCASAGLPRIRLMTWSLVPVRGPEGRRLAEDHQ
jgi:hypothetical protein